MKFSEVRSSVRWQGLYFDDQIDIPASVTRAVIIKPFRERLYKQLGVEFGVLTEKARKRQKSNNKYYESGKTGIFITWGLIKSAANQIYDEANNYRTYKSPKH